MEAAQVRGGQKKGIKWGTKLGGLKQRGRGKHEKIACRSKRTSDRGQKAGGIHVERGKKLKKKSRLYGAQGSNKRVKAVSQASRGARRKKTAGSSLVL